MMKNIKNICLFLLVIATLFLLTSCKIVTSGENTDTFGVLTVKCYDAGKGDAFLLSRGGFNAVIDCGYKDDGSEIADDLLSKRIKYIDVLIITHFDKDHVGGAPKLLKKIRTGRIITTYRTNDDKRTEKFFEALDEYGLKNEVPSSDIIIEDNGLKLLISPAGKDSYPDDVDNNSSLMVKAECEEGSMLFTGDAVEYRINEILSRNDLKSDVLKVPHHGTKLFRFDELLDKVSPSVAVITSSDEEPSDPEGIKLLDERNIQHYDTRDKGDFEIIFTKEGIRVHE